MRHVVQIQGELDVRLGFRARNQAFDVRRRRGHARHPHHQRVAEEDLREGLADDRANPPAGDRLRRMLARRSAAKVCLREQQLRATVSRVVERMSRATLGQLAPIVFEDVILEAVERDGLQNTSPE